MLQACLPNPAFYMIRGMIFMEAMEAGGSVVYVLLWQGLGKMQPHQMILFAAAPAFGASHPSPFPVL